MKLNSISMKSEQSVSWSLKRENQRHDCATPPRNYQKKNVYLCPSKTMQPHANGDAVALCSSLFSAAPSTWGFPEWKSCFLKTAPQLFLQRPSPSAWNLPVFTSSCACITFNDQILTCEGKFLHLVIPVGLSQCYCHQHEVFSWLRYAVCHAGPRGESSGSYSTLSLKRSRTTSVGCRHTLLPRVMFSPTNTLRASQQGCSQSILRPAWIWGTHHGKH